MQRDRRRCPGSADRYLARKIIAHIAMREDSADERRFSDRGDNTQVSGTSWQNLKSISNTRRKRCIQLIGVVSLGWGVLCAIVFVVRCLG